MVLKAYKIQTKKNQQTCKSVGYLLKSKLKTTNNTKASRFKLLIDDPRAVWSLNIIICEDNVSYRDTL